jgi:hypothetical protein
LFNASTAKPALRYFQQSEDDSPSPLGRGSG